MSEAFTFLFKEIIPDEDTFLNICTEWGLSNSDQVLLKYVYKILSTKFNNQNVRYSTHDGFLTELLLTLEDILDLYNKRANIAKSIYSLTNDDLTNFQEAINNMAKTPSYEITEAEIRMPLKHIDAQTFNVLKNNKLKSYAEALNQIPEAQVSFLIKRFKPLFMNYVNFNYLYKRSEE